MGGPWGIHRGGSKIPPILDPLEALILDPWDPLVMWNDDDGDDLGIFQIPPRSTPYNLPN